MPPTELLFDERPPSAGSVGGAPLLLVLHGWGMYKRQLFELTRGFDPQLTIVAVQAPVRMGPGAYRWFDFERDPSTGALTINEEEEDRSLAALLAFIEHLVSTRMPSALYLFGHSQGATMALSAALQRPARLEGSAHANGRLLPRRLAQVQRPDVLKGLTFFFGHGEQDPIIPLWRGQETRNHVQRMGGTVSFREYPSGHELTPEALSHVSAWLSRVIGEREAPRSDSEQETQR